MGSDDCVNKLRSGFWLHMFSGLLCYVLEECKDEFISCGKVHLLRIISGFLWYIAFSVTSEFDLFVIPGQQ